MKIVGINARGVVIGKPNVLVLFTNERTIVLANDITQKQYHTILDIADPLPPLCTPEWALYSMENGEKVRKRGWENGEYCYLKRGNVRYSGDFYMFPIKTWLKHVMAESVTDDWEIYTEPVAKFANIKPHDWIKYANGKCYQVRKILAGSGFCLNGMEFPWHTFDGVQEPDGKIRGSWCVKTIKPSEVVVDLGNGLKGTISSNYFLDGYFILKTKIGKIMLNLANFNKPFQQMIRDLLEQIEEEK